MRVVARTRRSSACSPTRRPRSSQRKRRPQDHAHHLHACSAARATRPSTSTSASDGDVELREGLRRPRLARASRRAHASRPRGAGSTRVRIEMEGKTKALVPEFTIKGPMQEQIDADGGGAAPAHRERVTPGGAVVATSDGTRPLRRGARRRASRRPLAGLLPDARELPPAGGAARRARASASCSGTTAATASPTRRSSPAAYSMAQVVDDLGARARLGGARRARGGRRALVRRPRLAALRARASGARAALLLIASGPGFKNPKAQAGWEAQVGRIADRLERAASRATSTAAPRRTRSGSAPSCRPRRPRAARSPRRIRAASRSSGAASRARADGLIDALAEIARARAGAGGRARRAPTCARPR